MKWVSIDPGSAGSGYAIWNDEELIKWGNYYNNILDNISQLIIQNGIKQAYIEKPQYMESNIGFAAARSDALVKLSMFCGALENMLKNLDLRVEWVPIIKWKGNQPKKIAQKKILKKIKVNAKGHCIDAIGIGLYILGEF